MEVGIKLALSIAVFCVGGMIIAGVTQHFYVKHGKPLGIRAAFDRFTIQFMSLFSVPPKKGR